MKKEFEKFDKMAKENGGIFLIGIGTKPEDAPKGWTVWQDEPKSPLFIFNFDNPMGFSIFSQCEKALADQKIKNIQYALWVGGRDNGTKSAQNKLIRRVNQTIKECSKHLMRNKDPLYVNASERMNFFIGKTTFGTFIKERYPTLFENANEYTRLS